MRRRSLPARMSNKIERRKEKTFAEESNQFEFFLSIDTKHFVRMNGQTHYHTNNCSMP